jgi:hypothetical protein
MGQGRKYKIDPFKILNAAKLKIGSLAQIGMQTGYGFAHKSFRRALVDFDLRVMQQQPQQFSSAIS